MQKYVKIFFMKQEKIEVVSHKNGKFHKTRSNCTQTVKFIQKIIELTKMTVIIICNSHQFHSIIKKCFSLCVWSE